MLFYHHQPVAILQKRWKIVLIGTLLFGILAGAASFLFPFEYRADAQALIISRSRYGIDPYTSVKSAERVGENIVQIIGTNDFFEKVMAQSDYQVDVDYFTTVPEREKRKRWQQSVNASVVYGTGVLNINAFADSKEKATALAGAVAETLARRGWEYVGGDVSIKVVNEPVATRWPARPNVIVNTVLGLIIGAIVMAFVLVRRYR